MDSDRPGMTEQLMLFEDEKILVNRGILGLTRLNLNEATNSFERYKALYPSGDNIDTEIALVDFLGQGFKRIPDTCPEEPVHLCEFWKSFEDYAQSIGFKYQSIISKIKRSFFEKIFEAINRCDLADAPYLSDTIPTGYVYIQIGQYDLAIKALQACIPLSPDNAAVFGYLGDAYMLRNEPDVARQCYMEACLIEPSHIDWHHVKDEALIGIMDRLADEYGSDNGMYLQWLPSYACTQGLFKPKIMKLDEGIKEFVNEYVALKKRLLKEGKPDLRAKLFFRGIIVCDNEPLLRFVKKIDFPEVRRQMKDLNPSLFSKYMRYVKGRKSI